MISPVISPISLPSCIVHSKVVASSRVNLDGLDGRVDGSVHGRDDGRDDGRDSSCLSVLQPLCTKAFPNLDGRDERFFAIVRIVYG